MEDGREEAHAGRVQRVVRGKVEAGEENAVLVGRVRGTLNEGIPDENVIVTHRS